VRTIYAQVAQRLASLSETPDLDASVLLAHISGKSRAHILAHPELELNHEQQNKLDDSLARLARGESFPYVLGKWEFFGNEFEVTQDVLIPRPETELLVEKAIAYLRKNQSAFQVADIGTGSGAIAISIARNVPHAKILATDISPAALNIAKRNAKNHAVEDQIKFVECDLLPNSEFRIQNSEFDLLCANLPYIPTMTMKQLSVFGREPTLALDGGLDGFDLYRRLFERLPRWLSSRALILCEIESTLGAEAIRLASDFFPRAEIHLHRDLAGKDRLLEILTQRV
jgi:release factor glutamine methyltransferase